MSLDKWGPHKGSAQGLLERWSLPPSRMALVLLPPWGVVRVGSAPTQTDPVPSFSIIAYVCDFCLALGAVSSEAKVVSFVLEARFARLHPLHKVPE